MNKIYLFLCFSILGFTQVVIASDYESRREDFISRLKNSDNQHALMLQAYVGEPLDQSLLDNLLYEMDTLSTADFRLVQAIRILFFTNGEYDEQILPVIRKLRLWVEPSEDWLVHYTENHMSQWMSSEYLLRQKYGWEVSDDLDKRLKHFLFMKVHYGYYEFFSSVYLPYTLSGLLNLVDFAEDEEIRMMASLAAERLLKEILMVTNDKGVFFPTAGRNYISKYLKSYQENHSALIYLTTGLGNPQIAPTHASPFLATSVFDPQGVADSYTETIDEHYEIGHSLSEGRKLNNHLSRRDQAIFQWSYGAYFHPYTSNLSQWFLNKYDFWDHKEFGFFSIFKGIPQALGNLIAKVAGAVSKSSVISGQTVAIYKNKGIVLTSVQDKWKGGVGYQMWPWCATVDSFPIFTASGDATTAWDNWSSTGSNTHLPYVAQESNVALIMYRPDPLPALLGFNNKEVVLFFPKNAFDEIRYNGLWVIGRKEDSYIAVRRYSEEEFNGNYLCTNADGQTWIAVVGNIETHTSFDNFEKVISNAIFYDNWYRKNLDWIYHASIQVDGKFIEHRWKGLFGPVNPITANKEASTNNLSYSLYPNPAKYNTTLMVDTDISDKVEVKIFNTYGQMVYYKEIENLDKVMQNLKIDHLSKGLYHVVVSSGNETQSSSLKVE